MPDADRRVGKIKVHYKGMSNRYDEVIDRTDFGTRVASVQMDFAKAGHLSWSLELVRQGPLIAIKIPIRSRKMEQYGMQGLQLPHCWD